MDDDISHFKHIVYDKHLQITRMKKLNIPLSESNMKKWRRKGYKLINMSGKQIRDWIQDGFKMLQKTGYNIFGMYPAANAYFMKEKAVNNSHINTKLTYIQRSGCGVFNKKEAEIRSTNDKED